MPPAIVRYPVFLDMSGPRRREIGRGVERLKVGDRVSVEGYLNCGNCFIAVLERSISANPKKQIGLTAMAVSPSSFERPRTPAIPSHPISPWKSCACRTGGYGRTRIRQGAY